MHERINTIIIIKITEIIRTTTEIIKMMKQKRNFILKTLKLISIKSEYLTNKFYI